jgi:hypothetical protein
LQRNGELGLLEEALLARVDLVPYLYHRCVALWLRHVQRFTIGGIGRLRARLAERGVWKAGLAQKQRGIGPFDYAIAGGGLEELTEGVRRAALSSCKVGWSGLW